MYLNYIQASAILCMAMTYHFALNLPKSVMSRYFQSKCLLYQKKAMFHLQIMAVKKNATD